MTVTALDEIEGKLKYAESRLARGDDAMGLRINLTIAIEQVTQCVRILRDAMKDAGTLRRIAERLETMEG